MPADIGKKILLAQFDTASDIYKACKKIRDFGYSKWDACTPFPIHGIDKAMGLKPSKLPWFVLLAGVIGGVSAMAFMIWSSAYDYPLNIGGKPLFSIPAFIPIVFEVTVLFSALTAAFGMLAINNLPTLNHIVFNSKNFASVTNDKFFIVIDVDDPAYSQADAQKCLQQCGAVNIEIVEDSE